VALDAETGSERWRARVNSEVLSIPAAAQGVVVVHTSDDKIYGLSTQDGTLRWGYSKPIPALTLQGSASPTIEGRQVLCGLASGKLIALDLQNGQLLWESSIALPGGRSELDRMVDIDGAPLLIAGIAFVATYQGNLAAVEAQSGGVFWRREFSTASGLGADRRRLYASDSQDRVHALSPRDGASTWTQEGLKGRRLTGPAVVGDHLVVGDADGYLHWLATEDGRLVSRNRPGSSRIAATPVVADGVVYVIDDNGDLFALSPGN
jgi:outer membrane protein assembly factor BamB